MQQSLKTHAKTHLITFNVVSAESAGTTLAERLANLLYLCQNHGTLFWQRHLPDTSPCYYCDLCMPLHSASWLTGGNQPEFTRCQNVCLLVAILPLHPGS